MPDNNVTAVDFRSKQIIDDPNSAANDGALLVIEPVKKPDPITGRDIENTLYGGSAALAVVGVAVGASIYYGIESPYLWLFQQHVDTYSMITAGLTGIAAAFTVWRNFGAVTAALCNLALMPVDYIRYRRYIRQQAVTVPQAELMPIAAPAQAKTQKPATLPPVSGEAAKLQQTLAKALDGLVNCVIKKPIIGNAVVFLPVQPGGELVCPVRGRIKGDVAALRSVSRDVCLSLPAGAYFLNEIPRSRFPGFAVPRKQRQAVGYAELIEQIPDRAPVTAMLIGQDQAGKLVITDLAEMPHMIVAGVTGSGKSIASYAMLLSLLERTTPEQLRVVIVDQKCTEYEPFFSDIGHLAAPIVTDSADLLPLAEQLVNEMKQRQAQFAELKVRDIEGYHRKKRSMPFIAVFIDELRDLLMELDKDDAEAVTNLLTRIVQRGRSAGIHLCIMTQRPDSEAVPGKLKSQMPGRLMLKMQFTDAQTLMTQPPADISKLRGKGDAYLIDNDHPEGLRIQCAFIDDKTPLNKPELEQRIAEIRKSSGRPECLFDVGHEVEPIPDAPAEPSYALSCDDPLYPDAVLLVVETGDPSKDSIRRAGVKGDRSHTRFLQAMDKDGFTGKKNGRRIVQVDLPTARTMLGF